MLKCTFFSSLETLQLETVFPKQGLFALTDKYEQIFKGPDNLHYLQPSKQGFLGATRLVLVNSTTASGCAGGNPLCPGRFPAVLFVSADLPLVAELAAFEQKIKAMIKTDDDAIYAESRLTVVKVELVKLLGRAPEAPRGGGCAPPVEPLLSFARKNRLVTLEKRLALCTDTPSVIPSWMWVLIIAAWLVIFYKAWMLPGFTQEEVDTAFMQGSIQTRKRLFFTQNKIRITCSISAAAVLCIQQRCSKTSLQIALASLYFVLAPTAFTTFASTEAPTTWLDIGVVFSWHIWANAIIFAVFKPRGLTVAMVRFVLELFTPALAVRKVANFFVVSVVVASRWVKPKQR